VIHHFESVDSTMRLAAELPIGDVVVADEQTAGQGRHGHSWHSEKDAGLYCSIVLQPTPLLTLALGLATAHVLPATCDLRWPNDVMIGGRKIAGILVNLVGGKAVAGIGINLNHTEFPPELEATSLKLATGAEVKSADLLDALLASVESYTQLEPDDILTLFTRASSYASGRRVTVSLPDGIIHGTTRGLNADGYLMLRKDDGTDTLILAGGVRAAGA
jgi:BirA family transcriptional regulator, biotin operon repressor / biotin---[acetyl-CoA-carboxylase] ligase